MCSLFDADFLFPSSWLRSLMWSTRPTRWVIFAATAFPRVGSSRPACPPALCFSTWRYIGWMQKALLLFLNSSLWQGQFCSVCLTCRCCCSCYWSGFTFHFLLDTCRCLQELPQFLFGNAFYSFSPPHFSCRKWRLLQSPFFLDLIAVLF